MKTEIEFLTDPLTGEQPVMDLIRRLQADALHDTGSMQLYKLVLRGLDFLRRYGLQEAFRRYFETQREDGAPYTIILVKKLKNHFPLLEFRVNWKGTGAFRAIFFEHQLPEVQVLAFARAVIKQDTFDPAFEQIAVQAEGDFTAFIAHPEKYISLVGDD